ncbi:hypothetical protein DFH08DRAFT_827517 [Mycena albidolilacea]|uniref:C2H2-type domain-containing protein n=1 Tax=Mycena albidolilacea TaxID=1033008 RepID=A0AAD7E736_9AGAR|nr:hypothetical protein DFH08DRAFT_827517 [Mycena albidolilacea]
MNGKKNWTQSVTVFTAVTAVTAVPLPVPSCQTLEKTPVETTAVAVTEAPQTRYRGRNTGSGLLGSLKSRALNVAASPPTSLPHMQSTTADSLSPMRAHKGNLRVLPKTKFCSLCPATFTPTAHLKRHFRSHTKDRMFRCNLCQFSEFTRSDLLSQAHLWGGLQSLSQDILREPSQAIPQPDSEDFSTVHRLTSSDSFANRELLEHNEQLTRLSLSPLPSGFVGVRCILDGPSSLFPQDLPTFDEPVRFPFDIAHEDSQDSAAFSLDECRSLTLGSDFDALVNWGGFSTVAVDQEMDFAECLTRPPLSSHFNLGHLPASFFRPIPGGPTNSCTDMGMADTSPLLTRIFHACGAISMNTPEAATVVDGTLSSATAEIIQICSMLQNGNLFLNHDATDPVSDIPYQHVDLTLGFVLLQRSVSFVAEVRD